MLEQQDLEFTYYGPNNWLPRLWVYCLHIVVQMNVYCACLLLIANSIPFTTMYPTLACCLY